MSYVLPILFVLGVYVALPVVLVAGWVRWVRRRQIGRTWPSLAGFSLGTASALLAIGSMVYAGMIGGFRYYDPDLVFSVQANHVSPDWFMQVPFHFSLAPVTRGDQPICLASFTWEMIPASDKPALSLSRR
jgi:hypothetical protein